MEPQHVSLFIAFSAGVASFASPCVLPLIPSYLCFISGLSFEDLTGETPGVRVRRQAMIHSLLFIGGFSCVFILLGLSITLLGQIMARYQQVIRQVGGVIIILLGVYLTGVIRFKFLEFERRVHLQEKPVGYVGSFLVGVTFAAGWTPCIGPILGAILIYAGTAQHIQTGLLLLTAYSLGLALPFLLSAVAITSFLSLFSRYKGVLRYVSPVSGVILILVGLAVFLDKLSWLAVGL
ncbi:MAG: cytochrome c biogenesis protein CcdA [Deltaproteobacteria bacterium]|nr:cytochrome c biogenesis protein CcdA [Deltaproteobacteria bacterium]